MAGVWRGGANVPPPQGGGPVILPNDAEQATDIADELRKGPYKPSDIMSSAKMATEWVIGGGSTKPPAKHTFIHYKFDYDGEVVSERCSSYRSRKVGTPRRRALPTVYEMRSDEAGSLTSMGYEADEKEGKLVRRVVVVAVATITQVTSVPTGASIPRDESRGGLQLHEMGQCTPCVRLNLKYGCLQGKNCKYCHLDHPARKDRKRRCLTKPTESKRLAQKIREVTSDRGRDTERTQERDKADMPGAGLNKLTL